MHARTQTSDKKKRPQSRSRNQSSGQSGVGRKATERKRGGLARERSTKETARDRASTKIVEALLFVPAGVFSSVQFHGNLHWTPQVLFTAAVLWAWSEKGTLTSRWTESREVLRSWFPSAFLAASYQAFIQTLAHSTGTLITVLMIHLHVLTLSVNVSGRVNGRNVFSVDGTKVGVPWSDDTDRKLGQQTLKSRRKKNRKKNGKRTKTNKTPPKRSASARKNSANSQAHQALRPQILLAVFWEMGTGLPWVWQQGSVGSSERELARQMLPQLPAHSIVVADAGFTGYEFWLDILDAGHDFVIRVGSNITLLKRLGWKCRTRGDLVYLWPAQQQRKQQPPLVVRLIAFQTRRTTIWVATSLTSRSALSDRQIETLYRNRWGIEGWFRTLKQTFGKRKMLSLTADHARCELDWAIAGLALIQAHGAQALADRGDSPHALSEAKAIRVMRSTVLQQDFQDTDLSRLRTRLEDACLDDYVRTAPKAGRHVHRQKTYQPAGSPTIIRATNAQQRLAQQIQAALEAA